MKKPYNISFGIILIILITSCSGRQNTPIGNWIEQDNFKDPLVYKIDQDYCYYYYNPGSNYSKFLYKIKKDTFLLAGQYEINKYRFEIKNDELKYYSFENDSLIVKFERNTYLNYIDYFNAKKNTSIRLPELESKEIEWHRNINSIVCDIDKNNKLLIYFNGEKHYLDSLPVLRPKPDSNEFFEISYYLIFCDKGMKLKNFNLVKSELYKAELKRVIYVSQNDSKNLQGVTRVLRMNILLDSLLLNYSTPNIVSNFENIGLTNILCSFQENEILVNNKKTSNEEFHEYLKTQIRTKKGLIINAYFDENLNYERYLNELVKIYDDFYSVRKAYSLSKYNEPDIEKLDSEKYNEVLKKYPIKIREIDKNGFEKLKKYAL